MPRNRESPVMMRFLIEFMFVNWRNDNPTEAGNKKQAKELLWNEDEEETEWITMLFCSKVQDFTHKAEENTVQCSKYREGYGCKDGAKFTCKIDINIMKQRGTSFQSFHSIMPLKIQFCQESKKLAPT